MTSSNDAALWQPWSPAAAVDAEPAAVARPPAPDDGASWLPALPADGGIEDAKRRQVEDEAYRRGQADALRAERERIDARCATALHAVGRVTEHLESIAEQFARDRESDLQAVAIAIARHLVQRELTMDPLRVGELLRQALELLPRDHAFEVRLHPDDLETLGESLARLEPEGRQVKLFWLSDLAIERGGFLIESPQRVVDGRTDVALRALYERLDHE